VIIAYLMSVGAVKSIAEGMRVLRSVRPGVRLHLPQRKLLRRLKVTDERRRSQHVTR
jgi:hypothetical protein